METFKDIHRRVHLAIIQGESDTRERFINNFSFDIGTFSYDMAKAFRQWKRFDDTIHVDKEKAAISGILYLAITLNISSMKLFIAGNAIASGNIHRQVLESIALAFLLSDRSLDTLDLFMQQKYPANDAIKDVIRHQSKLDLSDHSLAVLTTSYRFYHHYGNITANTIASFVSIADKSVYLRPQFDENKMSAYKEEIEMRVRLASIFSDIIDRVTHNVSQWRAKPLPF